MKKIAALSLLFLTLYSCNSNNKEYAVLSITGSEREGNMLLSVNDSTYPVKLVDGKFIDTVRAVDQYAYVIAGDYEIELFLEGGDNVSLQIDATKGINGFQFSGEGADKQQFLLSKQKESEKNAAGMDAKFAKNATLFKKEMATFNTQLKDKLKAANLSEKFTEIETKSIDFNYYNTLLAYPSYHEFLTKEKMQQPISAFMPKEFNQLNFDNEADYKLYKAYQSLVLNHYMNLFYKAIEPAFPNFDGSTLNFIKDIKIPSLKANLLDQISFFMSSGNEQLGSFYDALIAASSNEDFKRTITEKYNTLKNLSKGTKSPDFAYSQPNGDIVKSEDLKGKYVFISVWATWSEPWKTELSALEKIINESKNRNIAFVSISVDSPQDKEAWKTYVAQNKMSGIQLFADNSFNSYFMKRYVVDNLPRFILIDTEGKIISADAPKPSSELINSFLNENTK